MAENTPISPNYKKGFNQGYLLAKEIPEFSMKDIQNMPKSIQGKPRVQGMMDGMRQYHHEKYIGKLKRKAPKPNPEIKPNKGMNRN